MGTVRAQSFYDRKEQDMQKTLQQFAPFTLRFTDQVVKKLNEQGRTYELCEPDGSDAMPITLLQYYEENKEDMEMEELTAILLMDVGSERVFQKGGYEPYMVRRIQ